MSENRAGPGYQDFEAVRTKLCYYMISERFKNSVKKL